MTDQNNSIEDNQDINELEELMQDQDNSDEQQIEQEEQIDPTAKLKLDLDEMKDKYLRLMAEFDNSKKRHARERLELELTAAKNTMLAIIPSLDDFERAKKISEEENSTETFSEGVSLVYHKLFLSLKNRGLEPMDSNGQDFNPEFHEAITEIDLGEAMKGKVIDTVERGYTLNNNIIKYAKVVVGK